MMVMAFLIVLIMMMITMEFLTIWMHFLKTMIMTV